MQKKLPWIKWSVAALIIIALLWLLARGFGRDPRYIASPLLSRPAPDFRLELFGGREVKLEDFRGKAVFVNFWASWCPPCRAEARDLEAAWQGSKDDGVVFLGINIQDRQEAARDFLREFQVTYLNGRDASGKIAIDYGVWGIPEAFFVDPQGRITYKHLGTLGLATLSQKLQEARRGVVSPEEGKGSYQPVR
jgi:cytochrome c biogenesis protein CcmG/thiol:disulfide interchange protein DsbE